MKGYSEISTEAELDALLARVAGFHDSMAKELHLVNRGWVAADHSMMMNHRLDARVLIQSQWTPFAIELLFIGIEDLHVAQPGGEFWGGTGRVTTFKGPVERQTITISFDSEWIITAAQLFVQNRTAWLGPGARFGAEVPEPNCVAARSLGDGWRQCSRCTEGFEAEERSEYACCPRCGRVTEVSQ